MTDEEIIKRCKAQLKWNRSISVGHFIDTILKLGKDKSLIRRIRSLLLEDNLFVEDAEIDRYDFNRIRYAHKKGFLDYWAVKETIIAIISFSVGYLGGKITDPNKKSETPTERKTNIVLPRDTARKK